MKLSCRHVVVFGVLLLMAPAEADTAIATPPAASSTVTITGFRSAHFNMDEASVMRAIKTDFNISGSAVQAETNPMQYTKALRITVPALIPDSGPAVIDYVFGYKSHALSEVNVTWQVHSPGNSPAGLLHTGAALQNYFQSETFPPGAAASNLLLQNGVMLLFRGKDAGGHTVLLDLAGPEKKDASGHKTVLTPDTLVLIYANDPAHPDVFQLQPGAF